ncbi:MAG TPA: MOSC domain-containing protein [Microvirga sp.]
MGQHRIPARSEEDATALPSGRVTHLCIIPRGAGVAAYVSELDLGLEGVIGDRHADMCRKADARTPWHPKGVTIANTRHVSIVSKEECAAIAALLGVPDVDAAMLSANLMVEGIPRLSALPPATRLRFPTGATIFVTDQNLPCRSPGRHIARLFKRPELELLFPQKARGRRGLVGIVERPGPVRLGDALMLIKPLSREPQE